MEPNNRVPDALEWMDRQDNEDEDTELVSNLHRSESGEDDDSDPCDPDHIFTCWCGAQGTYEELFDDSDAADGCGGTGTIQCLCGGDFCVCHHHGEYECLGCDDCEGVDDDGVWDDRYDEDWDEGDD